MSEFWTAPHLPSLQHQLVGVAIVVWAALAIWKARSYRVWWPKVGVLLVGMLVSGGLFARFLALAAGDVSEIWWNPLTAGYSSFGLFVGAGLAVAIFSRAARIGFLRLVDVMTPGSLVALAIVRLGCLFRGCDFGAPADRGIRHAADSPITRLYPSGIDEVASSTVLHPLPVYLSLAALAGAIVALLLSRPEKPGRALAGAGTYFVFRAIVEPFRSPESAWLWNDMNANIILSVVAAFSCAILFKLFEKDEDGLPGT